MDKLTFSLPIIAANAIFWGTVAGVAAHLI